MNNFLGDDVLAYVSHLTVMAMVTRVIISQMLIENVSQQRGYTRDGHGVGHAGLVKLCRFLKMKSLTYTAFTKHTHSICDANKVVVTRMFDDAATIVHHVYRDIDSSIEVDDTINITISDDGSGMSRGQCSICFFGT